MKWRILATFFDEEPLVNWAAWGSSAGVFAIGKYLTLHARSTSLTLHNRSTSLTLNSR